MSIIDDNKNKLEKVIQHFKEDLSSFRTGRATPALVENIMVSAYGAQMPILQLASINVQDARTLIIQPWDKGVVKDIEKAIFTANLGVSPVSDGTAIRLSFSPITQEDKEKIIKTLREHMEKARIALRQEREKIKEEVLNQEKAKAITEDDRFKLLEKLDLEIGKFNDEIKTTGEKKEEEIRKV